MNGAECQPHPQVMLLRCQDIIKLPPVMDLGPFQPFAAGSSSTMTTTTTHWCLPPNESRSDWTVEILGVTPDPSSDSTTSTTTQEQDDNGPEDVVSGCSLRLKKKRKTGTLYHVHKDRLANGPRGSLYFANAFRSQCSTQNNNNNSTTTTVVTLPPKLAEYFPILLDFVYADGANVHVDSPAAAVAIRRLASYFGMAVLYANVNATYISTNLSNETVIDYIHESLRYGDESLYKATQFFLVQAISNGTLGWTAAMASLPLRTLLEIAMEVERNENFGPIVMEYIKYDARRVIPPEIVETLLDRLHPSFMQQCPYYILQVMERYQLPADHYLRRVCANTIAQTWHAQPYLRGGVATSSAVRTDHAKYLSLSDAQKVKILERSMQCAHDGREALGNDVRDAQIHLRSLAAMEHKLRFRTKELEAELARFARFRHIGVYYARGFYNGSNRCDMKPIATPKDRPRAAEAIGAVVTQEASDRVGSETLSLYVYKGPLLA